MDRNWVELKDIAPERKLIYAILCTYFEDIDRLSRYKNLNESNFQRRINQQGKRQSHPLYRINTLLRHLYSDYTTDYCDWLGVNPSAFREKVIDYIHQKLKIQISFDAASANHQVKSF